VAGLETLFTKALKALGFREWAYQVIRADALPEEKPVILTTYPDEWYNHYVENAYHLVDPVIQKGPAQLTPFTWSSMAFGIKPSSEQQRLFAEAADYRLGEGLGIPVHGAGGSLSMVSMVSEEGTERLNRLLQDAGNDVHLISLIFHNMARELLAMGRSGRSRVSLTPRERECLLWIAKGKTSWEIAVILGVSERTVNFHVDNARAKFGVASRFEAVIKAVMKGIIAP
tara:strand:- start:3770 stop:4453 length:684 start_codon:yes stop_codon:yes gene_type:complete